MKWTKLGRVFCAEGQSAWMVTGGRAPVAWPLGDGRFRVFFGAYDQEGRGRIFSLELDVDQPDHYRQLVTEPIIDLGAVGFYDDNGIIPSCIVAHGEEIRLYTIGFSLKNKILFDAATGLAISRDGGLTFEKYPGPVLDRGVNDPCFAASPAVMHYQGQWRMWYVSCDRWEPDGDGYRHYYNIKHRTSSDGVYWSPQASVCIDYANEFEYAISRPAVIQEDDGLFRMWYSFRAQAQVDTYRIGYAESRDGLAWERMDDQAGIDVGALGWDAEMICYPSIFRHNGKTYMLYNGNGYGRTGFGLAVLEESS